MTTITSTPTIVIWNETPGEVAYRITWNNLNNGRGYQTDLCDSFESLDKAIFAACEELFYKLGWKKGAVRIARGREVARFEISEQDPDLSNLNWMAVCG